MTYNELRNEAKKTTGKCFSCPECDGRACKNKIPGPGAKGDGNVAMRNFDAWKNVYVNIDTIYEKKDIDTTFDFFGRKLSIPVVAGPVGAISTHYGDAFNDLTYNEALVKTCSDAGIVAFTGDGLDKSVMIAAVESIKKANGVGVPTVKPWDMDTIKDKLDLVATAKPIAVAMDIDACGLPFLKNQNPPAGVKSVAEIKKIVSEINAPFILKGIMTASAALKAIEIGAKAIVVSNHGGRVQDGVRTTRDALIDIVKVAKGKCMIIVDGGIRTGIDVFRALALGADICLIARPFVNCIFGDKDNGVKIYVDKLKNELEDTMLMTGASTLKDITSDKISF